MRVSADRRLPGWPSFTEDDAQAVSDILLSGKVNYWTGSQGKLFEREWAELTGARYAVALANGTVALEIALEAAGIGPGDDVIVSPRTFVASASAIVRRGARPVFADVDRDSQNLTAQNVERVLTEHTRGIVAVHLAGWPCEMSELMALAERRQIYVIEDCAQAHGATLGGRPVGSLGHIAAFSFCQDKIITTGGEGGMLTTNHENLWKKAWSIKDHGKDYDTVFHTEHPPGFRWLHHDFGTNARMTEMQSALGRRAIVQLAGWSTARRRNATRLAEHLGTIGALRIPIPPAHVEHAYYKFYVFVRPERLKQGWSRDRVMTHLNDQGVPCFSGSCSEIYLEEAFAKHGVRPHTRLAVARELGETALMFLVHPTLSDQDVDWVADRAVDTLKQAEA